MLDVECGLFDGRGCTQYGSGWEVGAEIMKIMGKLVMGRTTPCPELLSFDAYIQFSTKPPFCALKIDLGVSFYLFKYGYIK